MYMENVIWCSLCFLQNGLLMQISCTWAKFYRWHGCLPQILWLSCMCVYVRMCLNSNVAMCEHTCKYILYASTAGGCMQRGDNYAHARWLFIIPYTVICGFHLHSYYMRVDHTQTSVGVNSSSFLQIHFSLPSMSCPLSNLLLSSFSSPPPPPSMSLRPIVETGSHDAVLMWTDS